MPPQFARVMSKLPNSQTPKLLKKSPKLPIKKAAPSVESAAVVREYD